MLLVASLADTKWCKKPEKSLKPWHMGTHLKVLIKSFPMSTNMTGFRWFSKKFCNFVLWTVIAHRRVVFRLLRAYSPPLDWAARPGSCPRAAYPYAAPEFAASWPTFQPPWPNRWRLPWSPMWTGVRLPLRPLLRRLLPAPLRTALTRLVADWACCAVWRWPGSRTAAAVWAGIGASPWCGGAAWSCSDWSGTKASSWESSWEWSCAAEEAVNTHHRKIRLCLLLWGIFIHSCLTHSCLQILIEIVVWITKITLN